MSMLSSLWSLGFRGGGGQGCGQGSKFAPMRREVAVGKG